LGFSHSENVRFAGPLLEKIRPKAKVYVINVDRFFVDSQTAPAEELFRGGDVESRYREKRFWQLAQGPLCKAIPSLCGQAPTFIRSRPNGSWKFKGTAPFQAQPVTYGADATLTAGDEYERLARTFVTKLRVAPSCVLLTIAPYPGTKLAEITSIADSLGLALIVPRLEGLRTFDGSHLDGPSAERWSNAFFEGAGPQIKRCLE
jgi:hypothetical protein